MTTAQPARQDEQHEYGGAFESIEILGQQFVVNIAYQAKRIAPSSRSEFERYMENAAVMFTERQNLESTLERQTEVIPSAMVKAINNGEIFLREVQDEFGFLNSLEVAEALGASASRSYASEQRKAGRLLALKRLNKYVYPGFQFRDGAIRPVIEKLIRLGRELDMGERDIIIWLCVPTTFIRGGARPVDRLDDTDLVLQVAESSWGIVD